MISSDCTRSLAGALLTIGFVLLLAVVASAAEPSPLRLRSVPLNPEDPTQNRIGNLEYLAGFELSSRDPTFGGLSGLAFIAQPPTLVAVSDAGYWFIAPRALGKVGRLVGLGNTRKGLSL